MGLNTAGIDAVLSADAFYVAIGDGPTGSDQVSAQRQLVTFTVAGGILTATGVPYAFTGSASGPATHGLLFDAPTAGTFLGFDALSGDQAFNADGDLSLTALTITGTSPA